MKNRKFKIIVAVTCVVGMTACAPILKSDVTSSVAASESEGQGALDSLIAASVGIYELPCIEDTRDTIIFGEDGVLTYVGRDYEAETYCADDPIMIGIDSKRIVAAEENNLADGSFNVTLEQGPIFIVVRDEDTVTEMNGYLQSELVQLGIPILANGIMDQPEVGSLQYQIYRFSESNDETIHQFGIWWDDEAHDGTSPEKRPVAFVEAEFARNTDFNYLHKYAGITQAQFSGESCIEVGNGSTSVLNLIGSEEAFQFQIYHLDDQCVTPTGYIVREFSIQESELGDIDVGLDRLDLTGRTHVIHAATVDQRAEWVDQCGDLDAVLTTGESYYADGICGADAASYAVYTSGYTVNNGYYLASGEGEETQSGDNPNERINVLTESIFFTRLWE